MPTATVTSTASLEREFKFDVDADFDPPDLREVVSSTERLPEQQMSALYYDTADHRLWLQGITFRFRSSSDGKATTGKWTLKLPEPTADPAADPGSVERTEHEWRGDPDRIPAGAVHIVAGLTRRQPLIPVAELTTTRRRLLLRGAGSEAWAEIDDDLVTVGSGPRAGSRFRQIEVELIGGAASEALPIDSVLDEFRRCGAAPSGHSKLGLALGLQDAPAATPRRPRGRAAAPAGVVGRVIADDLHDLLRYDYRLRLGAPGVDLVHDARVAARRLRSDLESFESVLDPVWLRHCRDGLGILGRALGRMRDIDVLADRIRRCSTPEDVDGVQELMGVLDSEREAARTGLADVLAAEDYIDLLDRLHAGSVQPPLYQSGGPVTEGGDELLRRSVGESYRSVARRIDDLGRRPSPDDLHRVRIGAKRLRYAAEAARPRIGKAARRTAVAAKDLQSVLGDLHDAAIATGRLRELATHPSVSPAGAFIAGRAAGAAEAAAVTLQHDWPKAVKRLRAKKSRTWLR